MTIASEFQSLFTFLVDTAVKEALQQDVPLAGTALQAVPAALFEALQDDIADALQGVPEDANAIATAIDALDGLTATASAGIVTISIDTSDTVTLPAVGVGLDLGISNLDFGLEGNASFTPTLSAALKLEFTYDTATGALAVSNGNDALKLGFDVAMAASGKADLGLLEVQVTDEQTDPEIALDLTVDIASGALSDLDASSVTVGIAGSASIDLHLRGDIPILPDFVADFVVDWDFSSGSLSAAPTAVKFENIGVDISSMVDILAEVMDPILGFTKEFPLNDIITGLTEPVPEPFASIINFLDVDRIPLPDGDEKINFLDFAAIYFEQQGNDAAVESLSLFAEAIGIIQLLTGGANDDLAGVVKLGDLDFTSGAANFTANGDAADDADGLLALAHQFEEAIEAIEGLIDSVQSSLAGGVSDTAGLAFPILDNPGSIVSLFLPDLFPSAGPVTFVEYDLPALVVEVTVGDFFFPIIGPIGINLGGKFNAGIDFKIAYDSLGLTSPGSDGFTPDDLLKGLVLKPTSPGLPVAFIDSEITAEAGVNLVVVKAFVGGGLTGEVNAFFPDDELRYDTVAAGCIFDPLSGQIGADLRVRFTVGFGPFSWTARKTLAETTLVDFSFGCDGDGTLATDPGQGLAALKAGDSSTLVLHAGGLANQRSINGTAGADEPAPNGGETFRIGNTVDQNGQLIFGALTVSAFGINETYGSPGAPILKIGGPNGFGNVHGAGFGLGHDSLVIATSVQQAADVSMGVGNDYATGGAGDDILRGDEGFDQLVGNGGNDHLFGGADDDTLEGGAGADELNGDSGDDQVTYENSAVAVIFNKAPDASGAFIGEGGEAEGDRLISIEYIIGSNFNDILLGNPTQGSTLEGRGGNDALFGGAGKDFLLGGVGGDVMNGGAETDGTSYLTSFGAVHIDLLFNGATGGDADGDQLIDMEDVQGTMFDDVLFGNNSANRLDGWYGNDTLEGRGGTDILEGGEGDDVVYAAETTGAGGDLLSGGGGIDLLSYLGKSSGVTVNLRNGLGGEGDLIGDFDDQNAFHQNASGFSGFENLEGTHSADNLTGDKGANIIWGLNGGDTINGDEGDDTLIGGAGGDAMTGGAGTGDWADYSTAFSGVIANLATGGTGGDADDDTYNTIENLRGSDHADTLTGDTGDNVIDPRLSLFGTDNVDGGAGFNTLYLDYSRGDYGEGMDGGFSGGASGIITRTVAGSSQILDRVLFTNIDRLVMIGTHKDDTVQSGDAADLLYAAGGDDEIDGGGGNDYINTEDGNDNVDGEAGADDIYSGAGDDTVNGGFGTDFIDPGLGADNVNGGLDYNFGAGGDAIFSSDTPSNEFPPIYMQILNAQAFAENGGDLLHIDYSSVTVGGVLSTVAVVQSAHPPIAVAGSVELGPEVPKFLDTNQGNYHIDGGTDSVDFTEIERVNVTGTAQDDVLIGTYDVLPGFAIDDNLSVSPRGDDTLSGLDGDDVLIGNTGDDMLFGGEGNDVLVGETNVLTEEIDFYDDTDAEYHVDHLTGGSGADLFVLGLGDTVFYESSGSDETDHAVIEDFDAEEGDRIQLSGDEGDYNFVTVGDAVHITLEEGGDDDLIAIVEDIALADLDDAIDYVDAGDPFPTPIPAPLALTALSSGPSTFSTTIGGIGTLAANWIAQTTDRDLLRDTLFGTGATGLTTVDVTLNGEGRAFGTFSGDPFGLGEGIVLSTGKVEDLEGVNTVDGGFFRLTGADLSTDLGLADNNGDTTQFVYTFTKAANASVDTLVFDFIMFSEEFREYGGSNFNDSFRILLNGVNLATLSDGSAATINNMMPSPFSKHPDVILNPVGTGPLADQIKADAYTKTLQFAGRMQDGVNTLVIEVKDVADSQYDSGILVKGGTFKAVASTGGLKIGGEGGAGGNGGLAKILEGDDCFKVPVTIDPGLRGNLIAPLVITITPSGDIDLGNGPGVPKVVTVNPGDPLTFELCVTAPNDRKGEGKELGTLNFGVESSDPAYDGLPVAPMVLEIVDALPKVTLVADQALEGSTGPVAFGDGVTIQGFDFKGNAAELGYGDGGVGVIGKKAGKKVESPFRDEVDFRGGKSERLVIKFDNPASDITLALGQFYADEKKRGELAVFTAFDADGNVVAAGVLDPAKATAKVSEAVFQFDLGLNGVSRIELTAADLYNGGKQGKPQSDFNLQSLSYAPTVATTDLPKSAITGTNGKDLVDALNAAEGQPGASEGTDVIAGIAGNDKLAGLGGNDTLDGGAGNDWLKGGDGDDLIIGGFGKDKVTGGAGADRYLFNAPLSQKNLDKITDFNPDEDLILLDDSIFTKLDPGALEAKAFFRGDAAKGASDRIGYDPDEGTVIYDKNGDKDGGDEVVAILKPGLHINEGSFLVV